MWESGDEIDRDSNVSDGDYDDIDGQSDDHLNQSSMDESMADSDDTTDSVKIMPISQEARQRQIEKIDDELTEKLSELRDIMASGGMTKSTQLIEQHFFGRDESPKCHQTKVSKKSKVTTTPWHESCPSMGV